MVGNDRTGSELEGYVLGCRVSCRGGSGYVGVKADQDMFGDDKVFFRFFEDEAFYNSFLEKCTGGVYDTLLSLGSHPYRAELLSFGEYDYAGFLKMEYGLGVPLSINNLTKDVNDSLDLVLKVCDAVSDLHSANLFHGDIWLSNILVDSDSNPFLFDYEHLVFRPDYGDVDGVVVNDYGDVKNDVNRIHSAPYVRNPATDFSPQSEVYSLTSLLYNLVFGSVYNRVGDVKGPLFNLDSKYHVLEDVFRRGFTGFNAKGCYKSVHDFKDSLLKVQCDIGSYDNMSKNDKKKIEFKNSLESFVSEFSKNMDDLDVSNMGDLLKTLGDVVKGNKLKSSHLKNMYNSLDDSQKKKFDKDIGIKTVDILDKYSPSILDDNLTRHFEEEMESIRKEKMSKYELTKIMNIIQLQDLNPYQVLKLIE